MCRDVSRRPSIGTGNATPMGMRHIQAVMVGAALLVGCSGATVPAQTAEIVTPVGMGHPAAAYDVQVGQEVVAHVTVWVEGMRGDGRTYVSIASNIQNAGARKLALDTSALRMQALDRHDRPVGGQALMPTDYSGEDERLVPPASTSRFDLTFVMPRDVDPAAVAKLRVTWSLISSDGGAYVQKTDFVAEPPKPGFARLFVPVLGTYDPDFMAPRDVATRHATVKQVVMPSRIHPQRD